MECDSCRSAFAVEEGIVDLLVQPRAIVARESAGLERFAEFMHNTGWDREKIRALPNIHDPYWWVQAVALDHIMQLIEFKPGETLLDIGSNTCWASNKFAEKGLDVIALDISRTELQGLRTAEYFIDTGEVYFERLLSDMAAPAIASESLDYVFCCEVLHHNDLSALRRTLCEIDRVLKPGGRLLLVNEPMRYPLNLKRDHGESVAHFEGNENVYFFHQYVLAIRRAGFKFRFLEPRYVPFFSPDPGILPLDHPVRKVPYWVARYWARRIPAVRNTWLAWKMIITGDVNLAMICSKPRRHGS